ncbi:MAG: GxxExxY protein [Thermodesulfobacteriota bacterium]|jgi:GxxExxY protein|nr:GxxExxY protein [Thermodesulfobacteriota bacterium]
MFEPQSSQRTQRESEENLNRISEKIILAAIRVHRELGPGLLESTYESCLAHELTSIGLNFERQKECPVRYRGLQINCGYRMDLLVQDSVVVELKATEKILPIHKAQLLSYLKMSNLKLGLLVNFNVTLLKDGICRIVN